MMLPVAILSAAEGNFGSRGTTLVDLVVLHCTEGTFHSACCWFANPAAKASAHYVVGRNGQIAQCVPEAFEAFHAGNSLYNRRSIGIEMEGYAAQPQSFPVDSVLFDVTAALVAEVCQRHGVSVDRQHIIGHDEVPDPKDPTKKGGAHHHGDPGRFFDRDAFVKRVAQKAGLA